MSELSADAKALIESTRLDDAPRTEDKDRIRARLAAQLGAGALVGTALVSTGLVEVAPAAVATGGALSAGKSASSGALAQAGVLRWFAAAATAGGLALGAYMIATPRESVPAAKVAVAPVDRSVEAPNTVPVEAPVVAPPAVQAPDVAAVQAPAAKKTKRRQERTSIGTWQTAGSSPSLSAEIALLGQAQKALHARDGQQALRLTRQHAENFPNGALYEERVGMEAIAHCILGERDHPAVRAFLARSPRSPLTARVRKECGVP